MSSASAQADVFTAVEIARAAAVDVRDVRAMLESGRVPTIDGRYVAGTVAADVVRSMRTGIALPVMDHSLFQAGSLNRRERGVPLVGSALIHTLMLGGFALLMGIGAAAPQARPRLETIPLVFLPLPGEGGGGGGGGLKQAAPPPRAELAGTRHLRSPVTTRRIEKGPESKPEQAPDPVPAPVARPVEPPPAETKPAPAPPVVAPVATVAADEHERVGLPDTTTATDSHGSGTGGGAGSGTGTGLGQGDGAGIGPGSGGGTGGGPYRPGAGITPPSILREVKPDYTEDARRRGITGDVELEIVVRSDGTVGDVRLLRGLGVGLDQRAIDAVRQWRFTPARRFGTPVDVIVEVAVEFRLR